MRLFTFWWLILLQNRQSRLRINYFDNVKTKVAISNRTGTWKSVVNLLNRHELAHKYLPVVPWVPISTILSWGSCCKNFAILTPSPLEGSAVSKFAAIMKFLSLSRTTTLCPRCMGDLSMPLTLIEVRPVPLGSSSPSATIATLTNPREIKKENHKVWVISRQYHCIKVICTVLQTSVRLF